MGPKQMPLATIKSILVGQEVIITVLQKRCGGSRCSCISNKLKGGVSQRIGLTMSEILLIG